MRLSWGGARSLDRVDCASGCPQRAFSPAPDWIFLLQSRIGRARSLDLDSHVRRATCVEPAGYLLWVTDGH